MKLTRLSNPCLTPLTFDRLPSVRDLMDAISSDATLVSPWRPLLDLREDAANIVVSAELPGLKREDFEISLHDGHLRIAGEKKAESVEGQNSPCRTERFYGKFRRDIRLNTDVDASKVSATYRDGVLTVTLPKVEAVQPKKIDVSVE